MDPLELPDRSPDARTAVESGESITDALIRAAGRPGTDSAKGDLRLQDVVDGVALDRLFSEHDPTADGDRAALVLELWGHLFVVRPAEVEVYR